MPFIVLTIVLFSTIEIAVKLIHGAVDPMLLAVIRFVVSGVLLALSALPKLKAISLREYFILIAIGAVGIAGTFGPFHYALSLPSVDAKDTALIFSLNPLFAALSALFVLHEKFSLRYLGGIILGFIGVYFVVFGWSSFNTDALHGPLIVLISAFTFGLYTTFSKKYVIQHGARAVTAIVFLSGGILLMPFVNSWEIPTTPAVIGTIFYLTIFTTYIGYLSYFHGLKKVSVSAGSSLFYLKPVIATPLAVLILNETPTSTFFVGMLLIFSAMALTLHRGKPHETR